MRRPIVLCLAFLVTLSVPAVPSPAKAQERLDARLALVSQSPWNGPRRPLRLSFHAVNTSRLPLQDLSIALIILAPARSRSVYELSLASDATSVIFGSSLPQPGSLGAGRGRTFRVSLPLDVLTARGESLIYPLRVELRSRDEPVGVLRTPIIFLIEPPELPLNLAWTWTLSTPLQLGPDGVFLAGPLEQDVAPGGRLEVMGRALAALEGRPVDVAVSPVLLGHLEEMADGYRIRRADGTMREVPAGTGGAVHAAELLSLLRDVARSPGTELTAYPYGDASLSALIRGGLVGEATTLFERGREAVEAGLGVAPSETVYRPRSSRLDRVAAPALSSLGVTTVLVDAGFIPTETGLMFSPPPVVELTADGTVLDAVLPDTGVMTLAGAFPGDPRLAAQAALGELAAIWLEFPGVPARGAAVLFPEASDLDPAFLRIFSSLVRQSPWLGPVQAGRLPSIAPPTERRPVPARDGPSFSPAYLEEVRRARASVAQFATTVPEAGELLERLGDAVVLGLSGQALAEPQRGMSFLEEIGRTIRATYAGVRIDRSLVTLASRTGFIPVTVTNGSGEPLRVRIRLVADRRVSFTQGSSQVVTLPPDTQTFTFPVRAETTGRFPIKVQVRTSAHEASAETIAETQLVVRSTAYNTVALGVTVGAGVFLLGWWVRRFIPGRRRSERRGDG